MKPDAESVQELAARTAELVRGPRLLHMPDGSPAERIAAAITAALSERDAEWRERLEAAEAHAGDAEGQRELEHHLRIEAERQRDEALRLLDSDHVRRLVASEVKLAFDYDDTETELLFKAWLKDRDALLDAHPEPAEQAATDEERALAEVRRVARGAGVMVGPATPTEEGQDNG